MPFSLDRFDTPRGRAWRKALDIVTTAAMLLASVAVIWLVVAHASRAAASSGAGSPPEMPPQPLEGAEVLGNRSAGIALVVYSDFQCPYCGQFARTTLPVIKKAYVDSGILKIAFRNLPLESIHPLARGAAQAAHCAAAQNLFWPMHDALFGDQAHLDQKSIRDTAGRLGVDLRLFDNCLDATSSRIDGDLRLAKASGISGTPSLLLGREQPDGRVAVTQTFRGAVPVSTLAKAIDDLSPDRK